MSQNVRDMLLALALQDKHVFESGVPGGDKSASGAAAAAADDADLSPEEAGARSDARAFAAVRADVERFRLKAPEEAIAMERESLLLMHKKERKEWEWQAPLGGSMSMITMLGVEYHSSKTPLANLTRIPISKMLWHKTHLGRYLLCRTIAPGVRTMELCLIIEDPEGWVHTLVLRNYFTVECASPEDVDALFPLGTIIAVREPTFEKGDVSPPIIRVASPSDVMFVDAGSDILRSVKWSTGALVKGVMSFSNSVDEWKKLGNAHFAQKRWFAAALAYSKGLVIDPAAHLLRLNRAEAYLRLGYFSAARADAEHLLPLLDTSNVSRHKALMRAAKAAYGQQDYNGAAGKLTELLRADPRNTDASQLLTDAQVRLRESREGRYDWARLYEEAKRSPKVDAADYVGPVKVAALETRSRGRGIIATRPIKVGELLLAAKPFVSVFKEELPAMEKLTTMDVIAERCRAYSYFVLVSRVASKLHGNPEYQDAINGLYAGPEQPPSPVNYSHLPKECAPLSHCGIPVVNLDASRLDSICSINTFSPPGPLVGGVSPLVAEPGVEDPLPPAALYLLPSLFNHACDANAFWLCIGDLMVIRAAAPIATGAEITIPYIPVLAPYLQRWHQLAGRLKECPCPLCAADRTDGLAALRRRRELQAQGRQVGLNDRDALKTLLTLQNEMKATYTEKRRIQIDMFKLHKRTSAAWGWLAEQDFSRMASLRLRSFEEKMAALEVIGVDISDKSTRGPLQHDHVRSLPIATERLPLDVAYGLPVLLMIDMASRYCDIGDTERGLAWARAGIWTDDMITGGGKRLLEMRYRAAINDDRFWSVFTMM